MYFVDQGEIKKTLEYIDTLLAEFVNESFQTPVKKWALERLTHILIEGIIDVGGMMIDGFIMRDAGSYEDIIDILMDEKVIPEGEGENFKAVIHLRQMVVRDYLAVDHKKIAQTIRENYEPLSRFSRYIRDYIENESDVANTFGTRG